MHIIFTQKFIDKIRGKGKTLKSENTWKKEFLYHPDMKIRYQNMLSLIGKQDFESEKDRYFRNSKKGLCILFNISNV